jgi:hypothetical protein
VWYPKKSDVQYAGTNPEQFDKLVRVVLGGNGDETDYNIAGTNLLITEICRDIQAIAEKINALKVRGGAQRVLIPYSCSDPTNPLNYFTGLKGYMPKSIYDLVNRNLPYNHYVILDVSIEDDSRTSITLCDPARGSRLDKDFITSQLNEHGNFTYEQMAFGLQDAYGSDSVNCGKYIILFILYLSNYEKNKGPLEEDGFQIVADDTLYPLIRNPNFHMVKSELFDTLQEMIDLDNQSMSNQLEAMSSSAAIDDDDEFDMIENFDIQTKDVIRGIEESNIMDLKKLALNISKILHFLDHKPKHVDRIKAEKNIIKDKIHN